MVTKPTKRDMLYPQHLDTTSLEIPSASELLQELGRLAPRTENIPDTGCFMQVFHHLETFLVKEV